MQSPPYPMSMPVKKRKKKKNFPAAHAIPRHQDRLLAAHTAAGMMRQNAQSLCFADPGTHLEETDFAAHDRCMGKSSPASQW